MQHNEPVAQNIRQTPPPSSGDSVGTIAAYLSRYVQVSILII